MWVCVCRSFNKRHLGPLTVLIVSVQCASQVVQRLFHCNICRICRTQNGIFGFVYWLMASTSGSLVKSFSASWSFISDCRFSSHIIIISVIIIIIIDFDLPWRAVLLSSRKVLVLEDPRELIWKSLSLSSITKSLSLSSDFKLLENLRGLHAFLKQSSCENFSGIVVLKPFPYLTVYRCWR